MSVSPCLEVFALLAVLLVPAGCRREASTTDPPAAAAEASWAEQVVAVRQGDAGEIHVTAPVSADDWNKLTYGCEGLTTLDVEQLVAPEESLSVLAALPQLARIRIGSAVGDAGLREIARIGSLRILNLPRGEFTDAGLRELTALHRLELLRIHSPHVTDDGMQHIAAIPGLRFLHLVNVPVTDAGLAALYPLEALESFYLDGGRCTEEGLSQLVTKLPELHFHWNQLHLPDDPHTHPH